MNHCCSRYVPCFNIYLIRHTNNIAALIASQIVVIMNNVCNMNTNMYTNMFVQITAWTWIQTWKTNTFMYECVHRNVFVHEHNVHGQWTCALTCLQTCKLTCKRTSTWTCAWTYTWWWTWSNSRDKNMIGWYLSYFNLSCSDLLGFLASSNVSIS